MGRILYFKYQVHFHDHSLLKVRNFLKVEPVTLKIKAPFRWTRSRFRLALFLISVGNFLDQDPDLTFFLGRTLLNTFLRSTTHFQFSRAFLIFAEPFIFCSSTFNQKSKKKNHLSLTKSSRHFLLELNKRSRPPQTLPFPS